jgi:ubiquinone/menaquinone biosynthesis C-methylase UbiE
VSILESASNQVAREKALVRSVYQQIAAEYDERIPGSGPTDEGFTQAERDFVLGKVHAGHTVLDMGCGTGRFTVPMAATGALVTGLDISREMLDVTHAKLSEHGLSADLREGDMARLPFDDNSFDIVTSMLALMHIPLSDRGRVFAEASRVLRPGGRLILGVKNSLFEQFFKGDRFAAIDVTDVDGKQLRFTKTRSGSDLAAPWYSFSPQELQALFAASGMVMTHLRGNSTISVWLADEVLRDNSVAAAIRALEKNLSDVPPFNYLGYHLLAEAVKLGN